MAIYLTADLHLNHKNIIEHCNRPFSSVEEMNETIVNNWNSIITKKDEVYILGDVCLNLNNYVKGLLDRLNGHIYLIKGNHDKFKNRDKEWLNKRFKWIKDYHEINYFYNGKRNKIVLSHYPMSSWNCKPHGSFMLFGHCHGLYNPKGRSEDVGIDTVSNYHPIFIEDILEKILKKENKKCFLKKLKNSLKNLRKKN